MTENTIENKARFISQHWGQKILCSPKATISVPISVKSAQHIQEDTFIILTPLEHITDEDAIEVAKLHRYTTDQGDSVYAKVGKDMINRTFGLFGFELRPGFCCPLETGDFLREKGYAVPFRDLTIADLISYGWVKLKTK